MENLQLTSILAQQKCGPDHDKIYLVDKKKFLPDEMLLEESLFRLDTFCALLKMCLGARKQSEYI